MASLSPSLAPTSSLSPSVSVSFPCTSPEIRPQPVEYGRSNRYPCPNMEHHQYLNVQSSSGDCFRWKCDPLHRELPATFTEPMRPPLSLSNNYLISLPQLVEAYGEDTPVYRSDLKPARSLDEIRKRNLQQCESGVKGTVVPLSRRLDNFLSFVRRCRMLCLLAGRDGELSADSFHLLPSVLFHASFMCQDFIVQLPREFCPHKNITEKYSLLVKELNSLSVAIRWFTKYGPYEQEYPEQVNVPSVSVCVRTLQSREHQQEILRYIFDVAAQVSQKTYLAAVLSGGMCLHVKSPSSTIATVYDRFYDKFADHYTAKFVRARFHEFLRDAAMAYLFPDVEQAKDVGSLLTGFPRCNIHALVNSTVALQGDYELKTDPLPSFLEFVQYFGHLLEHDVQNTLAEFSPEWEKQWQTCTDECKRMVLRFAAVCSRYLVKRTSGDHEEEGGDTKQTSSPFPVLAWMRKHTPHMCVAEYPPVHLVDNFSNYGCTKHISLGDTVCDKTAEHSTERKWTMSTYGLGELFPFSGDGMFRVRWCPDLPQLGPVENYLAWCALRVWKNDLSGLVERGRVKVLRHATKIMPALVDQPLFDVHGRALYLPDCKLEVPESLRPQLEESLEQLMRTKTFQELALYSWDTPHPSEKTPVSEAKQAVRKHYASLSLSEALLFVARWGQAALLTRPHIAITVHHHKTGCYKEMSPMLRVSVQKCTPVFHSTRVANLLAPPSLSHPGDGFACWWLCTTHEISAMQACLRNISPLHLGRSYLERCNSSHHSFLPAKRLFLSLLRNPQSERITRGLVQHACDRTHSLYFRPSTIVASEMSEGNTGSSPSEDSPIPSPSLKDAEDEGGEDSKLHALCHNIAEYMQTKPTILWKELWIVFKNCPPTTIQLAAQTLLDENGRWVWEQTNSSKPDKIIAEGLWGVLKHPNHLS